MAAVFFGCFSGLVAFAREIFEVCSWFDRLITNGELFAILLCSLYLRERVGVRAQAALLSSIWVARFRGLPRFARNDDFVFFNSQ